MNDIFKIAGRIKWIWTVNILFAKEIKNVFPLNFLAYFNQYICILFSMSIFIKDAFFSIDASLQIT